MSIKRVERTTRITRPEGVRRLAAAAAVLTLAAVAGCSSASPPAPMPPVSSQLRSALQHWSAFPVSAVVRPVVVDAYAGVTGPSAFPGGAAKQAFADGAIDLPRSLPAGPGEAAGYPLISAANAARQLTRGQAPAPTPVASAVQSGAPSSTASPATRLTVTGVKLGTSVVGTDRGQQALPAWQFSFRGVAGTADVLAVAASGRYWPAGLKQVATLDHASQPGRNGRTLTLATSGAEEGTGSCEASYSVRQQSSAHAVALYVVETDHGGAGNCPDDGFPVTVPVTLAAPLGNRVLVDALTYAPIPVTQSLVSSS